MERDSTSNRITAKRLVDFALLTFVKATRVDFNLNWEERKDLEGRHCGYYEVITFEWLDADYRLFADTLNGIIDVSQRRIKGLVVEKKSKNEGSFDFCRLLANEMFNEDAIVRPSRVSIWGESERKRRIMNALERANNKVDEDKKRLMGSVADKSLSLRNTYGTI